jgi:hypothetical protein
MPTEEEAALLRILKEPEIVLDTPEDEEMGEEIADRVATAFPEMGEKQRKVMEKVITAKMPTPEEIEQAERIAQHNAEVRRRREERLARRKARKGARRKKRRV